MNNEQSVKIYNMVATKLDKTTETELCGTGWRGQGRKGREVREGIGIKEGEREGKRMGPTSRQGGGKGGKKGEGRDGNKGRGGRGRGAARGREGRGGKRRE